MVQIHPLGVGNTRHQGSAPVAVVVKRGLLILASIVYSADDALCGRATVRLMHYGSGCEGAKGYRETAQVVHLLAAPECGRLIVAGHPHQRRGALTHTN